jgi:two-component system, LytTR family, response regulator
MFTRDDFIFLNDSAKCRMVQSSNILSLEADSNYTQIHLTDATIILIRCAFHKCQRNLDPSMFFRTSRGCIVNLSYVKEVKIFDDKRYMFIMSNGKEVILSRQSSLRLRREKSLVS